MNWAHLSAFVWLRWRLVVNQWRRAGAVNAVLMMIVTLGAIATAVPLFIGSLMLGTYAIPKAAPARLMYAWDALIVAFLFFWGIGLVTELQRTEPLSLSKFLHLPVSVNGAFLINYISSLVRLSLIVFVPIMLGFSLALVWAKGLLLAPVLPALAAFLLMVTALTYQLQGWLASLMSNPRRRRTVVVATTTIFVLIVQLPNLANFFLPRHVQKRADRTKQLNHELGELVRDVESRKLEPAELVRRQQEVVRRHTLAMQQADLATMESWQRTARFVNMILPIGWLPVGVAFASEGRVLPSVLGLLGMAAIGTGSLWLAYRTTVGMYYGRLTARKRRPAAVVAPPSDARKPGVLLVEARVFGLSEPVSAIALGGLRSLIRSPEAKMMLLTPVIMVPIFGSMLWRSRTEIPESMRPLIAIGGMVLVLLGVLQLMGNQFGFDRDGFRVFVLCAAPRRDILLGKNLAFAPVALGLAAIVLTIVQFACPMRLDHLLAMVPLYISMFLLFCIFTNLLSILAPVFIAAGSLKPSNPNIKTVLLQFVMFAVFFPLTQVPALLPLGTEALLSLMGWTTDIPICLLLSLAECALVAMLYGLSLFWQGDLLQAREQKILDSVTNRA